MAHNTRKTEHSGAKKGRGAYWGPKKEAKKESKCQRRRSGSGECRSYEEEVCPECHSVDWYEGTGGCFTYACESCGYEWD